MHITAIEKKNKNKKKTEKKPTKKPWQTDRTIGKPWRVTRLTFAQISQIYETVDI